MNHGLSSGGTCNMLSVFWQFAGDLLLLKSPRMIKTESGCCSVSVIRSASFCRAELT